MRGKVSFNIHYKSPQRITPAYAGKSHFDTLFRFLLQDHPRLCGEKRDDVDPPERVIGSPPPMRGKEGVKFSGLFFVRITPAYAGKSRL